VEHRAKRESENNWDQKPANAAATTMTHKKLNKLAPKKRERKKERRSKRAEAPRTPTKRGTKSLPQWISLCFLIIPFSGSFRSFRFWEIYRTMFFNQSARLFDLPSDVTVGGRHAISLCVWVCVCLLHCDCGLKRVREAERGGGGERVGLVWVRHSLYTYFLYDILLSRTLNG